MNFGSWSVFDEVMIKGEWCTFDSPCSSVFMILSVHVIWLYQYCPSTCSRLSDNAINVYRVYYISVCPLTRSKIPSILACLYWMWYSTEHHVFLSLTSDLEWSFHTTTYSSCSGALCIIIAGVKYEVMTFNYSLSWCTLIIQLLYYYYYYCCCC